jgi:NTE family protein
MKKLGIALGGGGAKGLAHIPLLEALDELGVKPALISGTSIGAVIGALYASGAPAREVRERLRDMTWSPKEGIANALLKKRVHKWLGMLDRNFWTGGLLNADTFLKVLDEILTPETFENLRIPLKVVAADFWKREQVVFESGELIPAIHASMALPGIFKPCVIGNRVFVDGGAVNPVPFDLLFGVCDVTVAIDVSGKRTESANLVPSSAEAVFNTFQIMQRSIVQQKLAFRPPDLYLEPDIRDIRVLDFHKADEVFRQAEAEKEHMKREIERLMAEPVKTAAPLPRPGLLPRILGWMKGK